MSNESGILGGQWRSKHLLAARALSVKDWEKPKDIIRARHMADEGATAIEIASALGWNVSRATIRHRLLKYRIKPFKKSHTSHRGELAKLGKKATPSASSIALDYEDHLREVCK